MNKIIDEIRMKLDELESEVNSSSNELREITQYEFFKEFVEPKGAYQLGRELGITNNLGYRLTKAVENKEEIVISASTLDRIKKRYGVIVKSERDGRGGKR